MRHRVLIVRCDAYDAVRIRSIVREGMEEWGVCPTGNVLLKPNAVIARRVWEIQIGNPGLCIRIISPESPIGISGK